VSKSPVECKCNVCECGIYTYNESQVCVRCEDNKHSSGQKRWSTVILKTEMKASSVEEAM
jgi:hypothetical protein